MSIIQILQTLGYDIISFNEDGEYKVQLGHERQKRHGYSKDTWNIKVKEVSFNKLGNLFVDFAEVGEDAGFDFYEHKNMNVDELY